MLFVYFYYKIFQEYGKLRILNLVNAYPLASFSYFITSELSFVLGKKPLRILESSETVIAVKGKTPGTKPPELVPGTLMMEGGNRLPKFVLYLPHTVARVFTHAYKYTRARNTHSQLNVIKIIYLKHSIHNPFTL